MANPLKKLSGALFGPAGPVGPQRYATDTSQGGSYSRMRLGALTLSREQANLPTPPPDSPVWAVLMETGHPRLTETLVLVCDGTSSVYVSNGQGVIGGHGFENVRKANAEFIRLANRDRHLFQATEAAPIPETGTTIFYARTDAGLLFYGDIQQAFIDSRHPLAELFQAGQEALTQLHIIDVQDHIDSKGSTSRDFYKSGAAYAAGGDFYRAIAAYNKAIERNPNYFDAHLQLGVAYGSLGNFDHALAELNRAIELDPGNPFPHMNRANVYKFKKQGDQVLADYDRAIELNPALADAYLERGLFYKAEGQASAAIRDLEHFLAISTDPQGRRRVEQELKKLR